MEKQRREGINHRKNFQNKNEHGEMPWNVCVLTHTDRMHSRISYASAGRRTEGFWSFASAVWRE
jgi:hypothetical protein